MDGDLCVKLRQKQLRRFFQDKALAKILRRPPSHSPASPSHTLRRPSQPQPHVAPDTTKHQHPQHTHNHQSHHGGAQSPSSTAHSPLARSVATHGGRALHTIAMLRDAPITPGPRPPAPDHGTPAGSARHSIASASSLPPEMRGHGELMSDLSGTHSRLAGTAPAPPDHRQASPQGSPLRKASSRGALGDLRAGTLSPMPPRVEDDFSPAPTRPSRGPRSLSVFAPLGKQSSSLQPEERPSQPAPAPGPALAEDPTQSSIPTSATTPSLVDSFAMMSPMGTASASPSRRARRQTCSAFKFAQEEKAEQERLEREEKERRRREAAPPSSTKGGAGGETTSSELTPVNSLADSDSRTGSDAAAKGSAKGSPGELLPLVPEQLQDSPAEEPTPDLSPLSRAGPATPMVRAQPPSRLPPRRLPSKMRPKALDAPAPANYDQVSVQERVLDAGDVTQTSPDEDTLLTLPPKAKATPRNSRRVSVTFRGAAGDGESSRAEGSEARDERSAADGDDEDPFAQFEMAANFSSPFAGDDPDGSRRLSIDTQGRASPQPKPLSPHASPSAVPATPGAAVGTPLLPQSILRKRRPSGEVALGAVSPPPCVSRSSSEADPGRDLSRTPATPRSPESGAGPGRHGNPFVRQLSPRSAHLVASGAGRPPLSPRNLDRAPEAADKTSAKTDAASDAGSPSARKQSVVVLEQVEVMGPTPKRRRRRKLSCVSIGSAESHSEDDTDDDDDDDASPQGVPPIRLTAPHDRTAKRSVGSVTSAEGEPEGMALMGSQRSLLKHSVDRKRSEATTDSSARMDDDELGSFTVPRRPTYRPSFVFHESFDETLAEIESKVDAHHLDRAKAQPATPETPEERKRREGLRALERLGGSAQDIESGDEVEVRPAAVAGAETVVIKRRPGSGARPRRLPSTTPPKPAARAQSSPQVRAGSGSPASPSRLRSVMARRGESVGDTELSPERLREGDGAGDDEDETEQYRIAEFYLRHGIPSSSSAASSSDDDDDDRQEGEGAEESEGAEAAGEQPGPAEEAHEDSPAARAARLGSDPLSIASPRGPAQRDLCSFEPMSPSDHTFVPEPTPGALSLPSDCASPAPPPVLAAPHAVPPCAVLYPRPPSPMAVSEPPRYAEATPMRRLDLSRSTPEPPASARPPSSQRPPSLRAREARSEYDHLPRLSRWKPVHPWPSLPSAIERVRQKTADDDRRRDEDAARRAQSERQRPLGHSICASSRSMRSPPTPASPAASLASPTESPASARPCPASPAPLMSAPSSHAPTPAAAPAPPPTGAPLAGFKRLGLSPLDVVTEDAPALLPAKGRYAASVLAVFCEREYDGFQDEEALRSIRRDEERREAHRARAEKARLVSVPSTPAPQIRPPQVASPIETCLSPTSVPASSFTSPRKKLASMTLSSFTSPPSAALTPRNGPNDGRPPLSPSRPSQGMTPFLLRSRCPDDSGSYHRASFRGDPDQRREAQRHDAELAQERQRRIDLARQLEGVDVAAVPLPAALMRYVHESQEEVKRRSGPMSPSSSEFDNVQVGLAGRTRGEAWVSATPTDAPHAVSRGVTPAFSEAFSEPTTALGKAASRRRPSTGRGLHTSGSYVSDAATVPLMAHPSLTTTASRLFGASTTSTAKLPRHHPDGAVAKDPHPRGA